MTDTPARPASDAADLDPNSLAAIRDLLASEAPVTPQPVAERVAERAAPQAEVTPAAAPRRAAQPAPRQPMPELAPEAAPTRKEARAAKAHAKAQAKAIKAQSKAAKNAKPASSDLMSKLTSYRPKPKHIAIAAAVLLVLFRPWLVFGVLFLSAFILTGVFLILGYDGFWRMTMRVVHWYARRRPARSAEIHRKLDAFAMKFDAFLDRFPEGSVDGLYLPDFGDLAEAEARHDEALDRRFEGLRESEA